ncbi:MAG: HD domain-containing protein [Holosporales bacterium]|jgi:putative nucleotidyltransferase with HDIG domain|nr:HD domain-containing protein [Holosporales bacterium]
MNALTNHLNDFLPKGWESDVRNLRVYNHSLTVAKAASSVASKISQMDVDKAYIYGLMHDVGKFYLSKGEIYKHPRVGYELLKSLNYDIAKICISHPFPDFFSYEHLLHYCRNDTLEANLVFDILKTLEKDNYVELIQFCDKISGVDSYVSIKDKVEWYTKTCDIGQTELSRCYLKQLNSIKSKFDKLISEDVYTYLGVPS